MFNFEIEESVNDLTFYNPSVAEKPCIECDFIADDNSNLEAHFKSNNVNKDTENSQKEIIDIEETETGPAVSTVIYVISKHPKNIITPK